MANTQASYFETVSVIRETVNIKATGETPYFQITRIRATDAQGNSHVVDFFMSPGAESKRGRKAKG